MIAAAASFPGGADTSGAREADRRLARVCAASPPDRSAWEQLYASHSAGVRQWIRRGRRLGSDEGVEDMLQQVFLLCAQGALARYRGETSLRAYLLRIAERVRISENRRLTRQCRDVRGEVSLDAPVGDGDDGGGSWMNMMGRDHSVPHSLGFWCSEFGQRPDEALEARERLLQINHLVDALEDSLDRKILREYFWESRKDREIAESLKISINTVTWRRHRAQARVEETWCQQFEGEPRSHKNKKMRSKSREGKKS